jgi:hypothetical protein
MKLFNCQACGQVLYFENTRCESCGHLLGYIPKLETVSAVEPVADSDLWNALGSPGGSYKFCKNSGTGRCNWMVAAEDAVGFCAACRHNHVIPDLTFPGNDRLWERLESAKRRLFYSLLKLKLPLENRVDNPQHGLAFDFLADEGAAHATNVLTGHDNGMITLALREADDAVREKVRSEMGEPYRTLLGHFRHESGHYYWDRLVSDDEALLDQFRCLFGDDRTDYAEALQKHYAQGAPADWQERYVSVYATTHPWEDFAETWAHYLHIADTLETAASFGLRVKAEAAGADLSAKVTFDPHNAADIHQLIDAWLPIAFAVNSLNRSMGQPDLYPFVLTPPTIEKLNFVHTLIHRKADATPAK